MSDSLTLEQCLHDFSVRANAHARVRTLLKDWNRTIVIEPAGTQAMTLSVANQEISAPTAGASEDGEAILLRADEDVLRHIFTGRLNPARAHLDGQLQVFADDRDQVKLDAISLILWGL
jgi:hypothetical protein